MKESVNQNPNNKLENGAEKLDRELQEVWFEVLKQHPELSRVEIIVPEADASLPFSGGEFLLPEDEYPNPAIVILPADGSLYEKLKETRPLAIQIAADLLGKKFEDMTGEDIKKFIFLHEVGHVYDFVTNFEGDSSIGDNAVTVWNMLRTEQMNSLPVSGLDPNDLKMAVGDIKELPEFIKTRPELEGKIKELNINTIEGLLLAQELAYRNTPKEAFADKFAAEFLKSRSGGTI